MEEITLDFETCKIIAHFGQYRCWAVFISKISGESISITIPQLIEAFGKIAGKDESAATCG